MCFGTIAAVEVDRVSKCVLDHTCTSVHVSMVRIADELNWRWGFTEAGGKYSWYTVLYY